MSFYEHLQEFAGKPVVDYDAESPPDLRTTIPRLRVEYDSETTALDQFNDLLQQPHADQLTGLVIGAWSGEMYDSSPSDMLEGLVAAADQLPALKALFIGDILSEENEVSWIHQTDVSALWQAFPRLEIFSVRGSNGLSLGQMRLNHLRQLTIEAGGLPKSLLAEVSAAHLPALEHLELYLGTDNYGWDGSVADLAPILSGKLFPKLKYLGLRDSEIADEVAKAVAQSPILERIEVLDLSLGTLSDVGGEALVNSPGVKKLKKLDLHHHYLSDGMQERLQSLGIEVNLDDAEGDDGDPDDRYVSISE
jgi:hypothetical protein